MTATTSTCPKANVPAKEGETLKGFEIFHGVPLAELGEEGGTVIALGHHEPRRFFAALCAYARSLGCDPYDYRLDKLPADSTQRANTWGVFYLHADPEAADQVDIKDDDWCVCEEFLWWLDPNAAGTERAIPTMTWRYG